MQQPGVILLSSSNVYIDSQKEPAKNLIFNPEPWLGIYRMQKWLEDREFARVLILDPNLKSDLTEQVLEFTRYRKVPIIGVSVTRHYIEYDLQNIATIQRLITSCAQPAPLSLAGGYEATLDSEALLALGFVDAVVQGFGEFPLEALLSYYNSLDMPHPEALRGCGFPGLVWKQGTESGPDLSPAKVLEAERLFSYEAQPLWEVPWTEYWLRNESLAEDQADNCFKKRISFSTSSHCQGTCGFCSSHSYGQFVVKGLYNCNSVLMTPAQEVADLVLNAYQGLTADKPCAIHFVDDDFVVGGKKGLARFEKFCDLMEEHYESGPLPSSLFLTMKTKIRHFAPDSGTAAFSGGGRQAMHRVRRAGFKILEFGVESFSDELLCSPFINKHITADINAQVVEDTLEAGIIPYIFYIAFPPTVTSQTFYHSLQKLVDMLEKGAWLGLALNIQVFPGSKALKYFGKPDFPGRTKEILNAQEEHVEIPDSILPADPLMNKALHKALEGYLKRSRDSLRSTQKPGQQILADTALFLGYESLYQRLIDLT